MEDSLLATENLDEEWLKLILEAKEIGLDKEDIRRFLITNTKETKFI
ncbi:anti-repressor SinI family protein [Cytobacillus horneckiae]|nr:anti-repressor SinI family protein [Cytobacillus horneckiae]MCM3177039.1 anti-repressor SinI family protein [Cytobacillus horneckiae]MEC1154738.1 anti-repressor SinI family protein [Cytobacillus horneckiae]MED2940231.1 anti-repressor SinI family protein [Cytobacillus horneckiae]